MVTIENFREMILAFEAITELPHFEKTSFRVNKKIVATLDVTTNKVVVKLSMTDQHIFTKIDAAAIYAVPNKWGLQGWTIVELKAVKKSLLKDILLASYCHVAPKKFTAKYGDG